MNWRSQQNEQESESLAHPPKEPLWDKKTICAVGSPEKGRVGASVPSMQRARLPPNPFLEPRPIERENESAAETIKFLRPVRWRGPASSRAHQRTVQLGQRGQWLRGPLRKPLSNGSARRQPLSDPAVRRCRRNIRNARIRRICLHVWRQRGLAMTKRKFHDLANIFPMLAGDEAKVIARAFEGADPGQENCQAYKTLRSRTALEGQQHLYAARPSAVSEPPRYLTKPANPPPELVPVV
jgi:hypothetical protein